MQDSSKHTKIGLFEQDLSSSNMSALADTSSACNTSFMITDWLVAKDYSIVIDYLNVLVWWAGGHGSCKLAWTRDVSEATFIAAGTCPRGFTRWTAHSNEAVAANLERLCHVIYASTEGCFSALNDADKEEEAKWQERLLPGGISVVIRGPIGH